MGTTHFLALHLCVAMFAGLVLLVCEKYQHTKRVTAKPADGLDRTLKEELKFDLRPRRVEIDAAATS